MKMLKKFIIFIISFFIVFGVKNLDINTVQAASFNSSSTTDTGHIVMGSGEILIGHSNVGEWNGGKFFETITYTKTNLNEASQTYDVTFYYYITHFGPSGSYCYQSVANYL